MQTAVSTKEIEAIVSDVLADDFNKAKIVHISVRKDFDASGDEILWIEVVYDGAYTDIDPKKIGGAVRRVRPRLSAVGETAFPLFSFISKRDLNAGRFAAA